MTKREPVEAWIVDDTGFLKQGEHSVGVQRQCTGTAGKVTNCQVATSLTIATRTEQLPIDFALYLPTSWTDDPVRRKEARIPWELEFATKPELGLELIRRALADQIAPGIILADEGYGAPEDFREGIRRLGLHYAVGGGSQDRRGGLRQARPSPRREDQRREACTKDRGAGRFPPNDPGPGNEATPIVGPHVTVRYGVGPHVTVRYGVGPFSIGPLSVVRCPDAGAA